MVLKRIKHKKKRSFFIIIFKFLVYLLAFLIIFSFIISILLYKKYIVDLPSVKELENLEIAKSSVIYDREGNELYKIFKEKRTYVPYEQINKNMINAIIAGEDKRYWENPGFDVIGIFRAGLNYISGKNKRIQGTSTITQQLIRNTIIANERKIERKIKEIYLAYKLSSGLSKKKIIELYLNKIPFGGNAYGVEQASQTFFGKKANSLGILESAILASLPKGPTYYSPYNHPGRVLGYPYVYHKDSPKDETKILTKKEIEKNKILVNKMRDFIKKIKSKRLTKSNLLLCKLKKENFKKKIRVDNDGCGVFNYSDLLGILNAIRIKGKEQYIEYQTGRKDFILQRLLEDNYISFPEYQNVIINSFAYEFKKNRENIETPHFVFFIKESLEKKYGKELIEAGGLKIYTTLDPELQKKAEEIVEKQTKQNKIKFGATNAALISIDNKNGDILTMVGGADYFDEQIGGNNNIITSPLQPGSSFKPFVYSLAIDKNKIGTKTPIYDLETKISKNYIPSNFDNKFMGKMDISTALNNSRNIPAIKMFFLAGGEKKIINYMNRFGVKSLKQDGKYGVPLALGTGEMTPLELAKAYSVFANMGKRVEVNSIIKILDSRGLVIEEKKATKEQRVIDSSEAYIINHILSDTESRPKTWNYYLAIEGRKIAAKTGTSTKQYEKGGKKYVFPRDLWTVGYTPQITTVVWAGNTNGKKLNDKGNGLEGAGPIWKEFMEFAHSQKEKEDWDIPDGVKKLSISKISGLLPSPENPDNSLVVDSLFKNPPLDYDNNSLKIKIDELCNGELSKNTPKAAIKEVSVLKFNSLNPQNPHWEDPVQEWIKNGEYKKNLWDARDIITKINPPCTRSGIIPKIKMYSSVLDKEVFVHGLNYIELFYKSDTPIVKLDILLGNKKVGEIKLKNEKSGTYKGAINIPSSYKGKDILTLRVLDSMYYSSETSKEIIIIRKDKNPPYLEIINPIDYSISLYKGQSFNLRGRASDRTPIRSVNIYIDGKPLKIGIKKREFSYLIDSNNLDIGVHKIKIDVIDTDFDVATEEIDLKIIEF